MPKLLQINATSNWGSTGTIAESIGLAARANGWETYLVHGARYKRRSSMKMIQVGTLVEEYIHFLRVFFLGDNIASGSRRGTRKLIRIIQRISPDVIHLHNIHGYYINCRVLFDFLNTAGIPVVWTLHDCWSLTGHCTHFETVDCYRWRQECYRCPQKSIYPRSLVDYSKKNYRLKNTLFKMNQKIHLVAVSEWLARYVQESFWAGTDVRVIYNGIDLTVFRPAPPTKRSGKFLILGVSSVWTAGKGYGDFIRLRQMLDPEYYDLLLVGVNQKQKDELMTSGILAINRTDNQQSLAQLYSDADVFLNLSYEDTLPTVIMEALACGVPVIAYRTGGVPEMIDEGSGILVSKGDLDGVVEAISAIRDTGRHFYSSNCRRRAERMFDRTKNYENYLKLYNDLA